MSQAPQQSSGIAADNSRSNPPTTWVDAAIKACTATLPAGQISAVVVAERVAELARRLADIKKYREYDPRELSSIVAKKDYIATDKLEGHTSSVECLQAVPDGRIISGSNDNTLRIWSLRMDGKWDSTILKGHTDFVRCLQALPDGRIVSGSADNTIRIWDGTSITSGAK